MLFDYNLQVSNDQADVRAAGTYESDDAIPNANVRQFGTGNPVFMAFMVSEEAFAGGTSVNFELVEADNAALTTNVVILSETGAIPTADLALGWQGRLPLPMERLSKAFIGMRYVGVGTHTAGKLSAGVLCDQQTNKGYPATTGF